jgi:hypothetical protein
MCRQGNQGELLTFLILDRTNGKILASPNIGGGDQITYDSASNRWFLADSRYTFSTLSCGGGSTECPLSPLLGVVDGTSRSVVTKVGNGNNAHSVAVSRSNHLVLTPFTSPSATGGGGEFPNGGISIYSTD